MAQKLRDLVVKTGTYNDNQGSEKARWQNIGALMKGDDGGEFVILHRWFNPAGIPNPDNRDSLLVSCFKPDQNGQGPQQRQSAPPQGAQRQAPPSGQGQGQGAPNTGGFEDDGDSIPFAPLHSMMGG